MSNSVAEGVITQAVSPEVTSKLDMMQFVVANAFTIVGGAFSAVFMIVVFAIFVKALRGNNLQDLFVGEEEECISMTKFWTNVAYFAATLAFLAANLMTSLAGEALIFIWLIFLGTVGANAIANKWLTLKYSSLGERNSQAGSEDEYRRTDDRYPRRQRGRK